MSQMVSGAQDELPCGLTPLNLAQHAQQTKQAQQVY